MGSSYRGSTNKVPPRRPVTPVSPHIVVGGPPSSPIGPPLSPPLRPPTAPQRAADINRQQRADVGTRLIRSALCLMRPRTSRCPRRVLCKTGLFPKSRPCGVKSSGPLERASSPPSPGLPNAPPGCSGAMPPGVVTAPPSSSAGCFGALMRPYFTDNSVISQGEIYQM